MSKHQQILDAVIARLRTLRQGVVLGVQGKNYTVQGDIGGYVFPSRLTPLSEGEAQALLVHADHAERMTDRAEFGTWRWRLPISLEVQARGKTAETIVRQAGEDIGQAVCSDRRWAGLARYSLLEPGPVDRELLAQRIYALPLGLTIEYITNTGEV